MANSGVAPDLGKGSKVVYDEEKDVGLLKSVLPLMSKHAAGYHPISYAVWYEYAKGAKPALK